MGEAGGPVTGDSPPGWIGALRSVTAVVLGALLLSSATSSAQPPEMHPLAPEAQGSPAPSGSGGPLSFDHQWEPVRHALISMPLAGLLAAALAFRPRRRGTPVRTAAVLQTQILLALVGAVVMLVVGSSIARAFGIVGAASLVRYRAKIDDPKDAGIMLATLGIGLASGVGLYFLAVFATVFILSAVWLLESLEPEGVKLFHLKVKGKATPELRPQIETILRRNDVRFELRTSNTDEVIYEVRVPLVKRTDRLSNAILDLDKKGETSVEWAEKKEKTK